MLANVTWMSSDQLIPPAICSRQTYSTMATPRRCMILLLILSLAIDVDLCPVNVCRCVVSEVGSPKRLLDCENRQLSSVPTMRESTEIFAGVTFQRNNIKRLEGYGFSSIKTESLDLTHNPLEHFDKMSFYGLQSNLKRLSLQASESTRVDVPFDSFEPLASLEELNLQAFYLGGMDNKRNFQCLPSLKTLRLVDVDITYLTSSAFENTPSITTLQIASCMTNASLPVSAISKLSNLQNLHFTDNGIRFVPRRGFYQLKNLTLLDLSGNPIHIYESQCFEGASASLQRLILSNTDAVGISFLSPYKWKRLRHLDVSHNNIQDIPTGIFRSMPFLTSLDLSYNKLSDLSFILVSADSLKRLESLDASGNNIQNVDASLFANMHRLYTLNLSKISNILNFTNNAQEVKSLPWKDLTLSETKIHDDEFWLFLHLLQDLATLNVDSAGLSHVDPNGFVHNKHLRYLSLRDNEISNLEKDAFKGLDESLEYLDLRDNRLLTVSECSFTPLESLQHVKLAGNPLRCDCHLKWLHEKLLKQSKLIETGQEVIFDDVTCRSPISVRNRMLQNLTDMTSCSHTEACRNKMAAKKKNTTLSEQHFYIMIVMLVALVVGFAVIFGVVLLMLKFKKSKAEKALQAIYKADSRKKTESNQQE